MKQKCIVYSGKTLPSIIYFGKKTYAPGELHVKRTFPAFNIQICEKGHLGLNEDGVEYMINEGQYFIMEPDLYHFGISPPKKKSIVHFIHFMPDDNWKILSVDKKKSFDLIDDGLGIYQPIFNIYIPKRGNVSPELMQRIKNLTSEDHKRSYIKTQQLFLDILDFIIGNTPITDSELIKKKLILPYIQKHFLDSDFSINYVSKEFGYSRQYLSRLIKKECGNSFSEIVIGLKVEYAKRQLAVGYISISEIAFDLGYNDVSAFSHMFIKKTGISPNSYKKINKFKR